MIDTAHFTAGLVTGFLGSAHCVGMCGPLVAALSMAGQVKRGIFFHLLYNLGRTATYVALGAVTGLAGSMLFIQSDLAMVTRGLLIFTDLLVIAAGLSVLGLFGKFKIFRLKGEGFVKPLTMVAAKAGGYNSPLVGFPVGVIFGFIPCGFTYAMLMLAAQSADVGKGALTMLGFGLGTAPVLFVSGSVAHLFRGKAGHWMIKLAGILIAAIGFYHLYRHLMPLFTSAEADCCSSLFHSFTCMG